MMILAWLHCNRLAVVPQGGNTGLVGKSSPQHCTVLYVPKAFVIVCSIGNVYMNLINYVLCIQWSPSNRNPLKWVL